MLRPAMPAKVSSRSCSWPGVLSRLPRMMMRVRDNKEFHPNAVWRVYDPGDPGGHIGNVRSVAVNLMGKFLGIIYRAGMAAKELCLLLTLTGCAAQAFGATGPVTFHRDVEPLLQAHCQSCHRPGEIGPMPLLTYQDARPWAKAIKQAVLARKRPPWFADSSVQHYGNDASLSIADIDTLTSWVDSGASEGDSKDTPAPRVFVEGWIPEAPVEFLRNLS
jgi:hypothetical protein